MYCIYIYNIHKHAKSCKYQGAHVDRNWYCQWLVCSQRIDWSYLVRADQLCRGLCWLTRPWAQQLLFGKHHLGISWKILGNRDWKFFENYSEQLSETWVSVAGVLSKFLEIQRRSTKSIAGKSVFSPNPSSSPSVARRAFLPRGAFSECCRICWGPKTYGRSLIPICSMYTIFINIYQYLPHKWPECR